MQQSLLYSLQRLAQLQRSRFDLLELQQIIKDECNDAVVKLPMLQKVCQALLIPKPKVLKSVRDPSLLPLLIFDEVQKWGILKSFNAKNEWVAEWFSTEKNAWLEVVLDDLHEYEIFSVKMKKKFDTSSSHIFQIVKKRTYY